VKTPLMNSECGGRADGLKRKEVITMTNLAIRRILNLADTFKALTIYKDTDAGFCEFGFGDVYRLAKYFSYEQAQSVNYKAVYFDGTKRRDGMLTIKRNGDFTFTPT